VQIGSFDEYCAIARGISWPEESAAHRAELEGYPDRFTAVSRSRLEEGKSVSAADYIRALGRRAEAIAELKQTMRDIDVLVLPTMKKPAQALGFEFTALGEIELSLTRPFNVTGGPSVALCNASALRVCRSRCRSSGGISKMTWSYAPAARWRRCSACGRDGRKSRASKRDWRGAGSEQLGITRK
jgi:hypothetical protein